MDCHQCGSCRRWPTPSAGGRDLASPRGVAILRLLPLSYPRSPMPEQKTLERALADRKAGKAPSTQAGEFIREQIDHIRAGVHGARSAKQAIAIGLSEARRAGVNLPPPDPNKVSAKTARQAARDSARGHAPRKKVSATRSRAAENALKREGSAAASPEALAAHARAAAARRSPAERSEAARHAARTKGAKAQSSSARKARARHRSAAPSPRI